MVALFLLMATMAITDLSPVWAGELQVEVQKLSTASNPPLHRLAVLKTDIEQMDRILAETTEIRENIFQVSLTAEKENIRLTGLSLLLPNLDRSGNFREDGLTNLEEAELYLGTELEVSVDRKTGLISTNKVGTALPKDNTISWGLDMLVPAGKTISLFVSGKFSETYAETGKNSWPPAVQLLSLTAENIDGQPAEVNFSSRLPDEGVKLERNLLPAPDNSGRALIRVKNSDPISIEPGMTLEIGHEIMVVAKCHTACAAPETELEVIRGDNREMPLFGTMTSPHYAGEKVEVYDLRPHPQAPTI